MRKLTAVEVKELNLLKHYRIIRKWACKKYDLNDADLELLMYLDCQNYFFHEEENKDNFYEFEPDEDEILEDLLQHLLWRRV